MIEVTRQSIILTIILTLSFQLLFTVLCNRQYPVFEEETPLQFCIISGTILGHL